MDTIDWWLIKIRNFFSWCGGGEIQDHRAGFGACFLVHRELGFHYVFTRWKGWGALWGLLNKGTNPIPETSSSQLDL